MNVPRAWSALVHFSIPSTDPFSSVSSKKKIMRAPYFLFHGHTKWRKIYFPHVGFSPIELVRFHLVNLSYFLEINFPRTWTSWFTSRPHLETLFLCKFRRELCKFLTFLNHGLHKMLVNPFPLCWFFTKLTCMLVHLHQFLCFIWGTGISNDVVNLRLDATTNIKSNVDILHFKGPCDPQQLD